MVFIYKELSKIFENPLNRINNYESTLKSVIPAKAGI